MASPTLEQLTGEILASFENYNRQGTHPWTGFTAVEDLPYQLGSLTKLTMQLKGSRFAEGKTEAELKAKMGDELADILAEVLYAAHDFNIDLAEAWQKMLHSDYQKVEERTDGKSSTS